MGYLVMFVLGALSAIGRQHQKDSGRDPEAVPHKQNHTEPPRIIFHPEDIREYRRQQEQQNATQKSLKRATWATFWAVLIYAGVTLGIYGVTKNSADAAKGAAEAARRSTESFEATHRAFVNFSTTVDADVLVDKQGKPLGWRFKVPVENSGLTPTREMFMHVNAIWQLSPITDAYTYPDWGTQGKSL